MVDGTEWLEIWELGPARRTRLKKHRLKRLLRTDLDLILREWGIKTVYFRDDHRECCHATARDHVATTSGSLPGGRDRTLLSDVGQGSISAERATVSTDSAGFSDAHVMTTRVQIPSHRRGLSVREQGGLSPRTTGPI